ncbi:MAG: ankyrin repeat domain-containing protein [Actinomycetales bacterium]|nr:ankyrin repeat domain-containing protein [Actinomycetales bacterium]
MTEQDQPTPEATTDDQAAVDLAHQLFDMARQGRTEQLAAYLDAGAPVDLTDPSGNTLVMLAAYHGHADLVRELGRRGADVDRLNDRGQSPLAGAVFKGDPDVVAALLEHGADPDAGEPTARATAELFGKSDLLRR